MTYGMSGREIDAFYDGYVTAILWANTYTETDGELESVDGTVANAELTSDAATALRQDVDDFLDEHVQRLIWGAAVRTRGQYRPDQAGHDFALTRNGHGAGFWDRGLGIVGDALTAHAKPHGERNLFVDSDGMAHTE